LYFAYEVPGKMYGILMTAFLSLRDITYQVQQSTDSVACFAAVAQVTAPKLLVIEAVGGFTANTFLVVFPLRQCHIEGCGFVTPDDAEVIRATVMTHHLANTHWATAPGLAAQKRAKVNSPTLNFGASGEAYEYFISCWTVYKEMTGITGNVLRGQLLDCASEKLRFSMFQNKRDITTAMEDQILASMKKLAIKMETVMVSRNTLNRLTQEGDEGIQHFSARVKGLAKQCAFSDL
jgi:hypothetical protein